MLFITWFLSTLILYHFLYLSQSQTFGLWLVTLIGVNPYRFSQSISIFQYFQIHAIIEVTIVEINETN